MDALFSPDSKFVQIMGRVADLMILNLLFLLSCIPVVTIGAAGTALYTVCFRMGTDRERGIFSSYFRAFRENFRQSTVLWLILALCGGTACFNTLLFYSMNGAAHFLFILFAALLVLVILVGGYVFPLLSRFSNDNLSTVKNALFLSLGYLPRSVLLSVLNVLPLVLAVFDLYTFLQAGFLWVAVYFSAAAYLNTLLLKKVFAPYLTEEEASAP